MYYKYSNFYTSLPYIEFFGSFSTLSEKSDSDPRLSILETDALPTELYLRIFLLTMQSYKAGMHPICIPRKIVLQIVIKAGG